MKFTALTVFLFISLTRSTGSRLTNALSDHTKITDINVFPYVVAVLKKFSYVCAGALVNEKWVLTAADPLLAYQESARLIKIRLGSINYKKDGVLVPVKKIEVHPLFREEKPVYDVALVMIVEPVSLTPTVNSVGIQTRLQEITATHFIVTAWTPLLRVTSQKSRHLLPMDAIKQRRILSVSHLHPSEPELCADEMKALDINETQIIMCLDPDLKSDPCWRDTGAPVVLNGILWGIVSAWLPDDCYDNPSTSFVNLVAALDIRTWIHSSISLHKWNRTEFNDETTVVNINEYDESNEIL